MSLIIFGALRTMHIEVDTSSAPRMTMNHQAEYTWYRPSLAKMSNQNGPNWLM